jgi:hypothetical protein
VGRHHLPVGNQLPIELWVHVAGDDLGRTIPRAKIGSMPKFLSPGPAYSVLFALGEALDLVDFGIVLLDHDLRPRFINRHMGEIWDITPALLETAPTLRMLLEKAATQGWFGLPAADLAAYLDEREAEIRAGSNSAAMIVLTDGRHVLFRCIACPDGGRLLTYADISEELQREAVDAAARVSAELRFNSEVLEEQGATSPRSRKPPRKTRNEPKGHAVCFSTKLRSVASWRRNCG